MTDEREHEEKDTLPRDNTYYIAPSMGARVHVIVSKELAKGYQSAECDHPSNGVTAQWIKKRCKDGDTNISGTVSEVYTKWHVAIGDEEITLVDGECLIDVVSEVLPDGGTGFIAARHIKGLTLWNLEDHPNHEVLARPGL